MNSKLIGKILCDVLLIILTIALINIGHWSLYAGDRKLYFLSFIGWAIFGFKSRFFYYGKN